MDYIIQPLNVSAYTPLKCDGVAEYLCYYSKLVYSVFGISQWWPPCTCTEPEFIGMVEGYRICTTPISIAIFIFWAIHEGRRFGLHHAFAPLVMCFLLSLKPVYIEVPIDKLASAIVRILTLANTSWLIMHLCFRMFEKPKRE